MVSFVVSWVASRVSFSGWLVDLPQIVVGVCFVIINCEGFPCDLELTLLVSVQCGGYV